MCPDLWITSLLFDFNYLLTRASLLALAKSIYYTKRAIDHEEKDLRLEGSPKSLKQIFPLKKRRTLAVSLSMGEE